MFEKSKCLFSSNTRPVVAPMLNCTMAERYANYWAGMDENVSLICNKCFVFYWQTCAGYEFC